MTFCRGRREKRHLTFYEGFFQKIFDILDFCSLTWYSKCIVRSKTGNSKLSKKVPFSCPKIEFFINWYLAEKWLKSQEVFAVFFHSIEIKKLFVSQTEKNARNLYRIISTAEKMLLSQACRATKKTEKTELRSCSDAQNAHAKRARLFC